MSRSSRPLATAVWVMAVASIGGWLLLHAVDGRTASYAYWGEQLASGVALSTLGVLVVRQQPRNALAWVFLGSGAVSALGLFIARFALATDSGPLGAASEGLRLIGFFALTLLVVLYPTGRPVSPRWRWVTWAIVIGTVSTTVRSALSPVEGMPDVAASLPSRARAIIDATAIVDLLTVVAILAGLLSLITRFIRSRGVERQQLKLFAYSAVIIVIAVMGANILLPKQMEGPLGSILWGSPGIVLPAAAAFAILRHGLYDIDRLISRTVSYALITAILLGFYALIAVVLPSLLLGGRDIPDAVIALGTLAAAAAFGPVRRWVQTRVDKRFNRARYDAVRTIEGFTAHLREQVDLDSVVVELESIADRTMRPAHLFVWMHR